MEIQEHEFNLLTEHLARPRHRGKLPEANGHAFVKDETTRCALQLSLRIDGGRVLESRWRACGDPLLGAIGSFVCECMNGWDVESVIETIRVEDVARTLRLPADKLRCVQLVVVAMLEAIQDHRRRHGHFVYGRASS